MLVLTPVNDYATFEKNAFEVGQVVKLDGFSAELNKEFRVHAISPHDGSMEKGTDLWLIPKRGRRHIYKSWVTITPDTVTISEPSLMHRSGSKY